MGETLTKPSLLGSRLSRKKGRKYLVIIFVKELFDRKSASISVDHVTVPIPLSHRAVFQLASHKSGGPIVAHDLQRDF